MVGTCRLTVLPAASSNFEKELIALAPEIVRVVISVILPVTLTEVADRPSGVIVLTEMGGAEAGGCA